MPKSTLPNTGYLLDPTTAQIKRTPIRELSAQCLRKLVECEALGTLSFDASHTLYFDDEGLVDSLSHYMLLDGHPDPLIGKVFLLANDAAAPAISMADVIDPVLKASSTTHADIVYYISAIEKFVPRIQHHPIEIV
jgi:hypothetical protein